MPLFAAAQATAAGVDHQHVGIEQRCDFIETQGLLAAGEQAAGCRAIQRGSRFKDFSEQRRHLRTRGGAMRAGQRLPRRRDLQRTHRQLGRRQFRDRRQRRRQRASVKLLQLRLGCAQSSKQQQPTGGDEPRLQRVGVIGVLFQRSLGRHQRARRSAEIAHRQRYFRFGDDTTGARPFLVRAEASRSLAQQLARTPMLAQLGHGNAAQRQRRRVVAQSDPLERAEGVASSKSTRGGGDQGIHADSIHCGAVGAGPPARIKLSAAMPCAR